MSPIKAFISYSSMQKKIGGRFKDCLTNYCGYEVFIAHSDMPGASIFEEEIIKAIRNTDLFIPLISNNFKTSDFADQETGIAVVLEKKIIPIKLGEVNPYGFISKYQALQHKTYQTAYSIKDNVKELVLAIAQIGLSYEPYQQKAINSLVHAFCHSRSFEATNATIEILSHCNLLTSAQLREIIYAIK